jgi:riboflavin synthase
MFTGIITHIGLIESIDMRQGASDFTIRPGFDLSDLALGASVAHDGCCLSIVSKSTETYVVTAAPETLSMTNLTKWSLGKRINLERSLKIGDELGGHIVSGHVDGLAKLVSITKDGEAFRLRLHVESPLHRFIAPKGSVALDGISLTVNEVEDHFFGVSIIPITWLHTNLSDRIAGDLINIEIDRLARYAARYIETQNS